MDGRPHFTGGAVGPFCVELASMWVPPGALVSLTLLLRWFADECGFLLVVTHQELQAWWWLLFPSMAMPLSDLTGVTDKRHPLMLD